MMTNPTARTIGMTVLIVFFYIVDSILARKYPYVGKRISLGTLVVFVPILGVLIQPIFLPKWGLFTPPGWMITVGYVLYSFGLSIYVLAKLALGSYSVDAVVPSAGYVSCGIYRYMRHPMYIGFILVVVGISSIGASILSLVAVITANLVYWYKAREEDLLQAAAEQNTLES